MALNWTCPRSTPRPVPRPGSSNFQIRFTPGRTGLRTATVTIANDSSTDVSVCTFAIQGTGAGSLLGDAQLVLPTAAVLPEPRPAGTLAEHVVADQLFEGDARRWLSEEWLDELSGSPSRRRGARPARDALFAGWRASLDMVIALPKGSMARVGRSRES